MIRITRLDREQKQKIDWKFFILCILKNIVTVSSN